MKSKSVSTRRAKAVPEGVAALPPWKAFVVQFSRETSPRDSVFSGRVEHLSSGRRARFASQKDLLAGLLKLIDQLGEESGGS